MVLQLVSLIFSLKKYFDFMPVHCTLSIGRESWVEPIPNKVIKIILKHTNEVRAPHFYFKT